MLFIPDIMYLFSWCNFESYSNHPLHVDKLEMKDDGKAIARVKPFTKDLVNENIPLSLYVKNLPTKDQEGNNGKKFPPQENLPHDWN